MINSDKAVGTCLAVGSYFFKKGGRDLTHFIVGYDKIKILLDKGRYYTGL